VSVSFWRRGDVQVALVRREAGRLFQIYLQTFRLFQIYLQTFPGSNSLLSSPETHLATGSGICPDGSCVLVSLTS